MENDFLGGDLRQSVRYRKKNVAMVKKKNSNGTPAYKLTWRNIRKVVYFSTMRKKLKFGMKCLAVTIRLQYWVIYFRYFFFPRS